MNLILKGILFSLMGGVLISTQNVFNTRLSDSIGQWETTMIVHFTGFVFALMVMWLIGDGNLGLIKDVDKIYLSGGILGVFIIFSTMVGISSLGASYSIALVVITQLAMGTIIDTFGLFNSPQISLNPTRIIGLVVMVIGVFIFQFGN